MFQAIIRFLFGGGATTTAAAIADARKRLVAAILELRSVVETGSAEQIAMAVEVFKTKAGADDLEPRELAGEVAKAEHMLAVLAYLDRLSRGDGVQVVAIMSDGEPAYFRATGASRESARDDDYGQLDIGNKGIFYDGTKRLTIVWNKVLTIGSDRQSLIVHPTRGGTPHTFSLTSQREAHLAHVVASLIFKKQEVAAAATTPRKRSTVQVSEPPAESSLLDLGVAAGRCNFNIVGESHYQGRLRDISKSGRSFTAILIPEPTNAYDSNAIRVVAKGGDTIGYLSKEDAIYYAPVLDLLGKHNRIGTCQAQLTGGIGEKRLFGVLLNLRDVAELLIQIRNTLEPGAAAAPATDDQPF